MMEKDQEKTRQQYDVPIAQIMQKIPAIFTDMLGLKAEDASFEQINLKQVEFCPDSILFLHNTDRAYIVEFQAQHNPRIFDKTYLEAILYEYQMQGQKNPKSKTTGGLIFFTRKDIIPKESIHKGKYNQDEDSQYRYICLEDYLDSKDYPWKALVLVLCEDKASVIKEKIPELWKTIEQQKNEGRINLGQYEYLKESIQLILSAKLTIQSKEEVNQIMGLSLNLDTPVFRQIRQEEMEKGILKGILKGKKEGMKKGMEKGMEKGSLLATRKLVLALIQNRFGEIPIEVETYIYQAKKGDLDSYFNEVSFSKNLEALIKKTKNLTLEDANHREKTPEKYFQPFQKS